MVETLRGPDRYPYVHETARQVHEQLGCLDEITPVHVDGLPRRLHKDMVRVGNEILERREWVEIIWWIDEAERRGVAGPEHEAARTLLKAIVHLSSQLDYECPGWVDRPAPIESVYPLPRHLTELHDSVFRDLLWTHDQFMAVVDSVVNGDDGWSDIVRNNFFILHACVSFIEKDTYASWWESVCATYTEEQGISWEDNEHPHAYLLPMQRKVFTMLRLLELLADAMPDPFANPVCRPRRKPVTYDFSQLPKELHGLAPFLFRYGIHCYAPDISLEDLAQRAETTVDTLIRDLNHARELIDQHRELFDQVIEKWSDKPRLDLERSVLQNFDFFLDTWREDPTYGDSE